MTVDQATELSRAAILLGLLISAPAMLTAVVLGLVISIMQAVTQIQDQTISFVPKIVAMLAVTLFALPWIMTQLIEYSTNLFREIPGNL